MSWQELYDKGEISTQLEPDEVVGRGLSLIKEKGIVLDIGAGFGRNTLYALEQGYDVEAIDLVDTNIKSKITNPNYRLNFRKGDITELLLPTQVYQGAIMTSVIQYIHPDKIEPLFEKIRDAIKPRGIVVLSYPYDGMAFDCESDLEAWKHNPEDLSLLLDSNHFDIVEEKHEEVIGRSGRFIYVNFYLNDIIARKR